MSRRFKLRGDNKAAFKSKAPALLVAGPSGTGKTIALLLKLLKFGDRYAGTRMLLVRKTRSSLTETGLVTWERDILGLTHPMLTHRPVMRRVRQDYLFANGSTLVVGGLDNPEKVLSGDFDLIYMLEATDFSLDDKETLATRLRTGIAPYQQIIADCNPTRPTHWLFNQTHSLDDAGKPRMIGFNSTHKDNPAYWSKALNDWTPLGKSYVETTLRNMTGARKKRFYEGIWAAAEGLVFDGYSPAVHDLPNDWLLPPSWRVFWTIDWGFTAPLCLQMWAIDENHRLYLFREIYQTGLRVELLAKQCRALVEDCVVPRPFAVVTDHDPEAQSTWREHSKMPCENAWKEDKYEGIEIAQGRFDLAGDGRPGIFLRPGARQHHRDETLANAGKPTSTMEELAGYVWDVKDIDKREAKEMPVKLNDHGCFAAGTMVETMSGPKPIEDIEPGEIVRTHLGYARVDQAAAMGIQETIRVEIEDGRFVVCTEEHPLGIKAGWMPAVRCLGLLVDAFAESSLWRSSSTPLAVDALRRRFFGKDSSFTATHLTCPTAISGDQNAKEPTASSVIFGSIRRFGSKPTGQFPIAWSFTTRTMTDRTTASTILRPLRRQSTPESTAAISPKPFSQRLHGTVRPPAESGTPSTHARFTSSAPLWIQNAITAAAFTRARNAEDCVFAPMLAGQRLVATPELTMFNGFAVDAASYILSIVIERRNTARKNVESRRVVRIVQSNAAMVYNLSTGDGTYFANGILVSNCDALRYACVFAKQFLGSGEAYSTGSPVDTVSGDVRNQQF